MDFSWTEEQQDLRRAIIDFAAKDLTEDVTALDSEGQFDRGSWRKCAKFGIQGLAIPEEYGGIGQDPLTTVYALETLGYACRDNGLLFSINAHMWTAEIPILTFGTEEQKRSYLPDLCSGEIIGGNAMSEPESGSDAFSLKTTARRKGDRYVLNGSKIFVTNGPIADLLVVFATVDPGLGQQGITAFLVPADSRGIDAQNEIHKMGNRTSPMGQIFLDNCEVPEENRLGAEGAGMALFTDSMTWERGFILATAVGAMQRQLERCVEYSKQRRQFDQPIGKFQMVASKLVDMKLRVETSRSLLYKAAWARSEGKSGLLDAAMAKLHISENWVSSSLDAIQIYGGYGYATEYEIERDLRDSIGSRLYSGTSEIQRLLIAALIGA